MERLRKKARKLRVTQTSAEARLWRVLRNRQLVRWKFRRQHPIDRYIVDFVTLDGRLIVEVDGATHSTKTELTRDAERTRILESLGYQIVRVTNIDVYENLAGVQELIAVTRSTPPHPRASRATSPHWGEVRKPRLQNTTSPRQ